MYNNNLCTEIMFWSDLSVHVIPIRKYIYIFLNYFNQNVIKYTT